MAKREMTEIEQQISNVVYETIQFATNNTGRSLQQQDFRLGMSDIGHCREYARRMILQEQQVVTDKTAAWLGTVLGDAIEQALLAQYPDVIIQSEVIFTIPSGGAIPGHPDIIWRENAMFDGSPQMVWDLKSKAEVQTVARYGQTQQQKFQLHGYAQGAIDAGVLDGSKPIYVADVYFDRSAKADYIDKPYVIGQVFDPQVINEIDDWITDVTYAVRTGGEASKDMERSWCMRFCPYADPCRTLDTDAEGLITDPETLASVDMYQEGAAMERDGKRLKNLALVSLKDVTGSTGTHTLRWVDVGSSEVSYTRAAYRTLSIQPIRKAKKDVSTG